MHEYPKRRFDRYACSVRKRYNRIYFPQKKNSLPYEPPEITLKTNLIFFIEKN